MRISGIYKIESKIKPARIYVGSSIDVKERWGEHLRNLKKNIHHSHKLQRHINKYTIEDLIFIILEPCLPEFLFIREQYYIDTLSPYFNECKMAGNTLGYRHSCSTIKKMSEYRKGKKSWRKGLRGICSKETIQKMSKSHIGNKSNLGRKLSKEHKRNISNGQMGNQYSKGYKQTEEHKLKVAKLHIGKKHSEETKEKMRLAWIKRKQLLQINSN